MEPVRELHQNDANIPGHGHGHLLEVFRLGFGPGLKDGGELRDAVDQFGNVAPEGLGEGFLADAGVLDHVVQQGGHERLRIHAHARQDVGDRRGMGDVGMASFSHLPFVGSLRVVEGPLHFGHGLRT